jgi:hypothetical protein
MKMRIQHLIPLAGVGLALALTAPGAAEVQFSGELRLRPERFDNADFNKSTLDTQSFTGSRLRLTASGLAAEDIAVKVTLQDTRLWGGEPGATAPAGLTDNGEAVDLHEGFVDFQHFLNSPVALRAGRQELSFGDQRLVGAFGWNNQGRAFDGLRLSWSRGPLTLDGWTVKRKESNGVIAVSASAATDRDFSGIYGTLKPLFPGSLVDFYYLHDREGDTTGVAEPKSVHTLGARLTGKSGGLDYTVEAPFQFGENGTVTASSAPVKIAASALAAKAGWTFTGDKELRLGLEYDRASGDSNAADDKAKTFQNLYPSNHLFYGFMDFQGWRNLSAWNVVASFKPAKPWFLLAQGWDFSLDKAQDGWYNAGGAAVGTVRAASAANGEKKVGREVDLLVRYVQTRSVTWEAGISHFFPGQFIKNRVASNGLTDWAYLMLTTKF